MTFGKKGLEPGQAGPAASRGFGQAVPAQRMPQMQGRDPALSQREMSPRDAFIAAERARTGAMPPRNAEMSSPGLSDFAQNYGQPAVRKNQEKSLLVAYILWFCLGQVSAHRFYLGSYQSAIVQCLMFFFSVALLVAGPSGALFGILIFLLWCAWILFDVFRIPTLHRRAGRGSLSETHAFF